ncbi:hypothetical protein [Candidatus Nitrosarchaeum limnium]|jgi:hypothetical protein|uniref:Uncharacterized protein n=1 Tax=Candidatus Nitrosarchaeum limnium BG20 TaxID=859192 RepID=S2E8F7_9ARCH|nr:hypothetical protein [Candidatus Nitrosarchaeum limnium]EPA05706.1 hypothetical protein BG20_I2418 [Candidatus Nitrosarchaeum limnium BG20]
MTQEEHLMDNLLNVDLEIIDCVRTLHQNNWDSGNLKQQIADLLKIRDDLVDKLMSFKEHDANCGCGHEHN